MDDSLYDSFRWLDEDTDLDLSLDNYPQQVASPPTSIPRRRRSSFRRTLSFNSVNPSRKSTSLASYGRTPISSPLFESQSALSNVASRRSSFSRPTSKSKPRHASRSSISSIDPSAQYYYDPEARLKLRVFLASPNKFDEALEYGFPALKEDGESATEPKDTGPDLQARRFQGTFLATGEDDVPINDKNHVPGSKTSRLSHAVEHPGDSTEPYLVDNERQSWIPVSNPDAQRGPNNREMTLRMTLTRPDLRADSCLASIATTPPAQSPPLPSAHDDSDPWEEDADDESLIKKMWRKFRKQID